MKNILMADDSKSRIIYAKIVEATGKYKVIEATTVKDVYTYIKQYRIDLLIIDRKLEVENDGIDCAWKLRQQGRTFPIVLWSAAERKDAIVKNAMETFNIINDYIQKPTIPNSLIATIEKFLNP